MLSALTAAYCGGNPDNILEAAAAATAAMGVAGDHCVSKNKGAGIGNRLVPRLSDGCHQLDGRRDITGRNER